MKMTEGFRQQVQTNETPKNLVFISWNIDGLSQHNFNIRIKSVCEILEQEKADIIFLQEVVPGTLTYLKSKLVNYQCLAATGKDYFVATLLRRGRVYLDRSKVVEFPTSIMQRHVMAVQAHCGSIRLDLYNTHLESMKQHGVERMNQLKQCLDQVNERPGDRVTILAGDLNMRDKELKDVGGLPQGVRDVWEECGSRKEVQYTWDMQTNSNLQADFGDFRPRCRFDRIYLKDSIPSSVKATEFEFVGMEKICGTQSFPSDHWGLRVGFSLKQDSVENEFLTEESVMDNSVTEVSTIDDSVIEVSVMDDSVIEIPVTDDSITELPVTNDSVIEIL